MDASVIILAFFIACVVYYLKTILFYNKWKDRGIPNLPNRVPLFGHVAQTFFGRKSLSAMCEEMYKSNANSSVCGFYFMNKPSVLVRDPELVKSVFQTNFQSFHENAMPIDPKIDPILAKHPSFISGEAWRVARNRVATILTGKKLAHLFAIVEGVGEKLKAFTDRKIDEASRAGDTVEFDLKDYFSRYTSEVVANSLGMEGHAYDDEDLGKDHSFARLAKVFFEASSLLYVCQILRFYLPEFCNFVGIPGVPPKVDREFRQILGEIVDYRRKTGQTPDDYLQFMLDRGSKGDRIEDSLAAEAMTFYFDTYETTSLTLGFYFYQLANHPEVQKKVREEVRSVLQRNDGQLTIESIKNLVYLEQALLESLRIIPSAGLLMKTCTKPVEFKGFDGLSCKVDPGDYAFVSIMSLHNDPEYWDEPQEFRPERFDPENTVQEKFTYLPFGEGPRMCVGKRLAMMLIKFVTAVVISKYEILPSLDKNELELSTNNPIAVLSYPKNGIWARFRKLRPEVR